MFGPMVDCGCRGFPSRVNKRANVIRKQTCSIPLGMTKHIDHRRMTNMDYGNYGILIMDNIGCYRWVIGNTNK